tara:strand:+ start:769 stop:1686 length:918 start_codon:yes stop_codon:yes gene_type:complete
LKFLKFIRYQNLLLIAGTQSIIHFVFLKALSIPAALSTLSFCILLLASLLIAAAGYIINDINDVAIDRINKPDRAFIPRFYSEATAYNYYFILNIAGVALGFFLSYKIGKSGFTTVFVLISALLYTYASFLKKVTLIGNLIVSLIVASSILVVIIFDLLPLLDRYSYELANPIAVLRDYAIFAFLLNFLREIIKDVEDVNGDRNYGVKSLAIIMGRERTSKVCSILAVVYIFLLIYYIYVYLYTNTITAGYLLFGICAPLLYFAIKAWSAENIKDFSRLSVLLKIIMLLGILSLLVLTLSLKYAG